MSSIWKSLLIIIALSNANLASAQEGWVPPPIVPAPNGYLHTAPQPVAPDGDRDALRMKNTGRALTYIGIASVGIVAAGGLMTYVGFQQRWVGGGDVNFVSISGFLIMMAGGAQGVLTLATGIPLWAVGAERERTSHLELTGLAVTPVIERGGLGGATAQIGFRF